MFLLKWRIYVFFLNNEIQKLFGDTLEKPRDTQMCRDTMVENHCSMQSNFEQVNLRLSCWYTVAYTEHKA